MNKSLRDMIYEKIRENITWGRLTPGERLVEDRLAEEFKASRSPVREALRLLEAEGLIIFERNRGITVAKLSIKQVAEIYDLRWLLEGYAARVSGAEVTATALNRLKKIHEELKSAAKDHDLKKWFKKNAEFHNYFYKNCGNENLVKIVDNLKRRVQRYDYISMGVPWDFETYLNQHKGMLEGCERKDGEMVEKYMQIHLETVKVTLINHLKNQGIRA